MDFPTKLTPVAEKYFIRWISASFWYRENLDDMERFYRFIRAVKRYNSKKPPPESLVRELIMEHGGKVLHDRDYLESNAERFTGLYKDILEYEQTSLP
jgi:hypothetical protein